jgi:predicted RND superfamily exporter protein
VFVPAAGLMMLGVILGFIVDAAMHLLYRYRELQQARVDTGPRPWARRVEQKALCPSQ